jgi:hypothetical protein
MPSVGETPMDPRVGWRSIFNVVIVVWARANKLQIKHSDVNSEVETYIESAANVALLLCCNLNYPVGVPWDAKIHNIVGDNEKFSVGDRYDASAGILYP